MESAPPAPGARYEPSHAPVRQQMLLAGGAAGLILIIGLGFWFLQPKQVPAAAVTAQEPVNPPVAASIPAATPPPQAPQPPAAASQPAPQPDDTLRLERERLAAERAKLEQAEQQAREQDQRRQQEAAQRQQDAEAQQRVLAELTAKQAEQQRQIEAERLRQDELARLRAAPAPTPIQPPAPEYTGPRFGEIVWEGIIKGTELITVENGQASSGTVSGRLPGVAVLLQPTDVKKVSIASTPGPRNQYNRLVFRVSGNGNTRIILKWSLP